MSHLTLSLYSTLLSSSTFRSCKYILTIPLLKKRVAYFLHHFMNSTPDWWQTFPGLLLLVWRKTVAENWTDERAYFLCTIIRCECSIFQIVPNLFWNKNQNHSLWKCKFKKRCENASEVEKLYLMCTIFQYRSFLHKCYLSKGFFFHNTRLSVCLDFDKNVFCT